MLPWEGRVIAGTTDAPIEVRHTALLAAPCTACNCNCMGQLAAVDLHQAACLSYMKSNFDFI